MRWASCAVALIAVVALTAPVHAAPEDDRVAAAVARHDWDEAERLLDTKLKTARSPVVVRQLADVRAWKGDIKGAVPLYRELLDASPDDLTVVLAMANALSWSKDVADQRSSLAYFDRYLRARPHDDDARLQRARVRAWTGDVAGAEREYRAYLKTHDNDEISLELAKALSWSKDHADLERSLPMFDHYIAHHPDNLDARLERGRVRGWVGKVDEARADFEAYLRQHPDDDAIRLELAKTLAEGSDPGSSIALYDAYLEKHPDDDSVRLQRARAQLWNGDVNAAEPTLERLSRKTGTREAATLELARLYSQTGRRALGVDTLIALRESAGLSKEAREELERMSVPEHVNLRPSFFVFADKSKILLSAATVDFSIPFVRNLRLVGDFAGWRLTNSQETLLTGRADLGLWARIPKVVELEAVAGPRAYQLFSTKAGVRAQARAQPTSWIHVEGRYAYDDLYIDLFQPATVPANVRGHAGHLLADLSLPLHIQLSGRGGVRLADPSNLGLEATGTATIRVVAPLSVGYNVQWLKWRYNDPAYWSPQGYASHLFLLRLAQEVGQTGFAYDVQGSIGVAAERIQGVPQTGYGPAWGFSGALTYAPTPHVSLGLSAQYGQTQRQLYSLATGGTSANATPSFVLTSSSYYWMTSTAFLSVNL